MAWMPAVNMLRSRGLSESVSRGLLVGASVPALLMTPSVARAQSLGASGEADSTMIVVTAQRREELSRDVPITINTASAAQLTEANVESLVDLPKLAPGVRIDQQGAYTQPTIRGIGTTVVQTGVGSSVGVYVDGYYLPSSLSLDFQFLNVENVQVLKGPQGTLFGRNTTGGAILVQTADPSHDTSAIVDVSYRRFNGKKAQAYFTEGISDSVAISIEGAFSEGDGFTKRNLYDGSLATGGGFESGARIRHPGAYENWSTRLSLKWDASDVASILLRYSHTDKDDPAGYMFSTHSSGNVIYSAGDTIPGTVFAFKRGEIAGNARNVFRMNTDTVQMTGHFDLGFADLTSYSQYRDEFFDQGYDSDYSSAPLLGIYIPEKDEIISQELLLSSRPGGRFQYTSGVFFFQQKIHSSVDLAFGSNDYFPFTQTKAKVRTFAAYFDGTYEIIDNLFLTAGVRYSHDEVKSPAYQTTPGVTDQFTFQPDFKGDRLSPRVVLRYKPSEESSVYASFTKGYKSAIPDFRRSSAATGSTYKDANYLKPEDINAFEAGFKYASRGLTAELAAFYYDYKNLQNGFYRTGVTILSNAAKARIKGVEGSLSYDFGNGLELSASATYLDPKYRDYPTAGFFNPTFIPDNDGDGQPEFAGFDTSNTVDASGNLMSHVPKFSGTFAARYSTELAGGELVTSANLYHTSKLYFDAANQFGQGSYDIVSARMQWTDPSERYTVAVFGDNLLDEKYITQLNAGPAGVGALWGEPATYGVSLQVRFGGS